MSKVVIIKYNAGNVQSVIYALNKLGVEPIISDDPDTIKTADKVIFPGVGEASTAMNYLKNRQLDQIITDLKQPFLGVCLGLQLMCKHSEENNTTCLGVFDLLVKKFPNSNNDGVFKVPQMGWNSIYDLKSPLFETLKEEEYVYFVHSYYAELGEYTIAQTNYATKFSAALMKDNFFAVQFHPEKSAEVGSKIIDNFLKM